MLSAALVYHLHPGQARQWGNPNQLHFRYHDDCGDAILQYLEQIKTDLPTKFWTKR